jgi:ArsR family metal-binding transcriptional regulator
MLLNEFTKEFFRPKCNPNFQSIHCVAHLEDDISKVLPYLNTSVGGGDYSKSPPALTLQVHGKLISLHAKEIFINALNDETEADKILSWLKKEINEAWDNRDEIVPTFEAPPCPQWLEILKLLPRTNCKRCGEPTCTVFSLKAVQGVKGPEDCLELVGENKIKLEEYLKKFHFDI